MSNNMYDILGKLQSLTPKQEAAKPAKPLYESVEAKGSIVAGVKDVEQRLREQFEAMDEERETLKTKQGTIYKGGSYGNADYDSDGKPQAKGPIVRRKNADGTSKKGRPSKAEKASKGDGEKSYSSPKGDIFGRTTGAVPKGKTGRKIAGKGNVDTVDETASNPYAIGMAQAKKEVGLGKAKATGLPKKTIKRGHHIADVIKSQTNESKRNLMVKLSEGVNFNEMMKERGRGIDELLAELQNDIKSFKETGHVTDFLRDCMEVHGYGKKQLQDAVNPERGHSFAPQHAEIPPLKKPGLLDKAKSFGQKTLNTLGHGSDEEMIADLKRKTMGEEDELNELAKLAGLQVEESIEQVEECMSPIAGGAVEMQSAEQQQGRMSVNTSADSEGHKTVTITADGEQAEKLAQLLSLAGLNGGQHQHQPQPEEHAAIVVAQEAKAYGDTEVEEPEEVLNSPRPDVQGMHRSPTTGLNQDTDDLNKPKSQNPTAAAKGDNPLTKKEKAVENFNPLDQLGAQLMAEYQSIKVQK